MASTCATTTAGSRKPSKSASLTRCFHLEANKKNSKTRFAPCSAFFIALRSVQVADVLRGAVLSPVFAVDTFYNTEVSSGSLLFKLPVDAVQRGRDHGLPTYNEARLVS